MNPLSVLPGMVPMFAFSLLVTHIPAGWAALIAAGAALAVTALTARNGIQTMPLAQAVMLFAFAVLAFTGGAATDQILVKYGPALQAILLGMFMVATAAAAPFTAQAARSSVPREVWNSRRFLEVNQQISTAWGLTVLVLGACQLAGAEIPLEGSDLALRLAVNWVVPVLAIWRAISYTRHTAAGAEQEARERVAQQRTAG